MDDKIRSSEYNYLPDRPQSRRLIDLRRKVGLVNIYTLTEFISAPVRHIKIINKAKKTLHVDSKSKAKLVSSI
jgi:hypothetical protein